MAPAQSNLAAPLPQNIDAERSVLGAILLDNSALGKAVEKVSAADFFHEHHRKIFSAMLAMQDLHEPIDLVMLTDWLAQKRELEIVGGAAYISALLDGVPHASNVEHYAQVVREKSLLRRVIHATERIQREAMESKETASAILERAESELGGALRARVGATSGNGAHKLKSYALTDFLNAQFPTPEHLVEQVIPRGGSILIIAMPHRLKSWFTTALALACTRAGIALGKLEVKKPVRTLLMQAEDFPGVLQKRVGDLMRASQFLGADASNLRIIPRCGFHLPDEAWYQELLREVSEFKADHVVLDVVRRVFHGDINSPVETADFVEHVDRLRDATDCAVTLVHHENKKGEDIMTAGAGSYTLPSWANVVIQFKRKSVEGGATHVEIEVDNKLAQSPEPMRMVLDLASESPVRVELLEEGSGFTDAMERLGQEWTVRDLAEALDVAKPNAYRRLKRWVALGKVEKISAGKRGRQGGLARYHSLDPLHNGL